MAVPDPSAVLELPDAEAWDAWLSANHADAPEAWLRIAKRGSGLPVIAIADALDVALCWGWIDGRRRSNDAVFLPAAVLPTPVAQRLVAAERRQGRGVDRRGSDAAAGMAQVDAAKADGRWAAAYERQSTAEPPADLVAALAANPAARAAFDRLSRSDRYLVIMALAKARTPATRARTLARAIEQLTAEG